jgi:uncharacterized membrane protein SpoIIM required for sporulation
MNASDLVLVQGLRDTRGTLTRWTAAPVPVVGAWVAGAAFITLVLLLSVGVIATFVTPDPTPIILPGLNDEATLMNVRGILVRNSLVLALHAFACVAGFIAGSSLPMEAERYSGVLRWIHDKAGPLAIAFVSAATAFSLFTQAFVLGHAASTLAAQGSMSPLLLIVGLMPHAVPELIALFLPLAAWIIASRRKQWHELLAATFATVAIATPVLIAAAFVEVYVSPSFIRLLQG